MNILPNDILLDIAEYTTIPRNAGRYSSIGLSNYELLRRILYYDQSFSYNEWIRLLEKKREFQSRYGDSNEMKLISLIKKYENKHNISIYIFNMISRDRYTAQGTDSFGIIQDIRDIFGQSLLAVITPGHIQGRYILNIDNFQTLFPDYNIVYTYMNPREDPISMFVGPVGEPQWIGTTKNYEVAKLGDTPNSLEEVLARTISRETMRKNIISSPLYYLAEFLLLIPFTFQMYNLSTIYIQTPSSRGVRVESIRSLLPPDIRDIVEFDYYDEEGTRHIDIVFPNETLTASFWNNMSRILRFFEPYR